MYWGQLPFFGHSITKKAFCIASRSLRGDRGPANPDVIMVFWEREVKARLAGLVRRARHRGWLSVVDWRFSVVPDCGVGRENVAGDSGRACSAYRFSFANGASRFTNDEARPSSAVMDENVNLCGEVQLLCVEIEMFRARLASPV